MQRDGRLQQALLNKVNTNSFLARAESCVKLWHYKNDHSLYQLPLSIKVHIKVTLINLKSWRNLSN